MNTNLRQALALVLAAGLASPQFAHAQARPDPAAMIAAQREALKAFAFLDGLWRGPAWTLLPSGEQHQLTQTERVGTMLDGSVGVIEGKGYEVDGRPSFNAFATISFDVATKAYRFHSHAQGRVGDFVITPSANGYVWEIPAGPQMTIRYTAEVKGGEWFQYGESLVSGRPPTRIFEMRLKRLGDTTWPAGDAVGPK